MLLQRWSDGKICISHIIGHGSKKEKQQQQQHGNDSSSFDIFQISLSFSTVFTVSYAIGMPLRWLIIYCEKFSANR